MKVIEFLKVALLGQKFEIQDCTCDTLCTYQEDGEMDYSKVKNLNSEVSAIGANNDTVVLILASNAIIRDRYL